MKARIALSGALVIEPETELEGFALRCWEEKFGYFDGDNKAYWNLLLKDSVPIRSEVDSAGVK